jgi:hypothetical protein
MTRLIKYYQGLSGKSALKLLAILCLSGLLLLAVLVAALPSLVSWGPVQELVKGTLNRTLQRPVTWSRLDLGWQHGLLLSGLVFGDGPPPLLKGSCAEVAVDPSLGFGSDGRFGIDLQVRIRNVSAELVPGPPKPPKVSRDPLTALADVVQSLTAFDRSLPVDIRVALEIDPLRVIYRDQVQGKSLYLDQFSWRFAMPSLATKVIRSEVTGKVALDGHNYRQIRFNTQIKGLVDPQRNIRPAGARLEADADLPGVMLTVRGGVGQSDGLSLQMRVALAQLLEVARPFLPPAVPVIAGNLAIDLSARTDASHDLHAVLETNIAALSVRGGPVKKGVIGPLDLQLNQQLITDHKKQQVAFPAGKLVVPGMLDASWSATVERPSSAERTLTARLGPIDLNLEHLLRIAGPLLPARQPLSAISGNAFVRGMELHLNGKGNNGTLRIDGSGVKLSRVMVKLANSRMTGEDLQLNLDQVDAKLVTGFPADLTAAVSWGAGKFNLSGKQPVSLRGGQGSLQLAATGLKRGKGVPLASGSVKVSQTMALDQLQVEKQLTMNNLHEQATFMATAASGGTLEVSVPALKLTVASLSAMMGGKQLPTFPLAATLAASGLQVNRKDKYGTTLQRGNLDLTAGDFLKLTAAAGLDGGGTMLARTSGEIMVDLGRLAPVSVLFLPPGSNAEGQLQGNWSLEAPLPLTPLATEKNPLRKVRAALALLNRGEMNLKLEQCNVQLPVKGGKIMVTGLTTTTPLRLVHPGKGEKLKLGGGVKFAGVSKTAGNKKELPPQGGFFAVAGELAEWKELQLSQELRLEPLGITQVAEGSVTRIDALLDEQGTINAATALKRLDATIFAHMDALFSSEMTRLLPGMELSGSGSAGARIDLAAARELRVRGYARSRGLGVNLTSGTRVEGIDADLLVDRSYALAARNGERWVPLSVSLVSPAPRVTLPGGAREIAERVNADLRGEVSGPRKLRIRRITTRVNGLPLELTDVEGELLLEPELAGFTFLQAELLGGTVQGRGTVDLRPEIPRLASSCSFSSLDTALLFPSEPRLSKGNQNGEIAGELSLESPLLIEQRPLLEGMRMTMNIRKISSRILEQALFSLDPYERNEQLVQQRKTLRLGNLKWLSAGAVDGALHLDGEIEVKGVVVAIPKVERVRIAELPIRKELARVIAGITKARAALEPVRADTITIGPKGEIALKRRSHAE